MRKWTYTYFTTSNTTTIFIIIATKWSTCIFGVGGGDSKQ